MENLKGKYFVGSWGYDQTQYSIYKVVEHKGHFVLVQGLNSWSSFSDSELAVGSTVKVYNVKNERFHSLTEEQRQTLAKELNFNLRENDFQDFESMVHWYNKEQKAKAEPRTIVKKQRINGENWSFIWTLDNKQIVNSKELYNSNQQTSIVNGLKRCKVQTSTWSNQLYIKIDQSITAYLDNDYKENVEKYEEQNLYTAYNGR